MGHSMRQYSEINDTAGGRKSSTRAKSKARILRKSMKRSRFMAIILTKYEYAISAYFRLLAAVSLLTWTWYTVQFSPGIALSTDPLVAGVDFAWGGSDDNVVRFRRGLDARSIKPIKVKGEFTRDAAVMVGKIAEVLDGTYDGEKVAMMFFDSAGIASSVYSGVRALGYED